MAFRLVTAFLLPGAASALSTHRRAASSIGSSLAQLPSNESTSQAGSGFAGMLREVAAEENTTVVGATKLIFGFGANGFLHTALDGSLSFAEAEVAYELGLPSEREDGVHNKISLVIVSMLGLGFCGIDRCCMGQIFLGVMKGLSCGGLFVWFIADYWVILINALAWRKALNTASFAATFSNSTVAPAFFIALVLLFPTIIVTCSAPRQHTVTLLTLLRRKGWVGVGPFSTEIREVFSWLDRDGNGFVDKEELNLGLRELGCKKSDEEVEKIMQIADKNGDGKLSIDELVACLTQKE